jgi:CSLREA domain-containing protein
LKAVQWPCFPCGLSDLVILRGGHITPTVLETASALTFTVNSAADTDDGACNAQCTLREAIKAANANPGADTIQFNLGAGNPTINIGASGLGGLPNITDTMTILGNTGGATRVELNGSASNADGLRIYASNCTVRNMIVNRFAGIGISTDSDSNNNIIAGNLVGVDSSGTIDLGNSREGISISNGSNNNMIGGTIAGDGNIISGNDDDGISIAEAYGNLYSTGNQVFKNFVGTNAAGTAAIGNSGSGVYLGFASSGSTLNSTPGGVFRVDFFSNPTCDAPAPNDYGEGKTLLGAKSVQADGNGNAAISATFATAVPVGQFITATATTGDNNTSEFSRCVMVTASPGTLQFSAATYSVNENGVNATITVTRTVGSYGAVSVQYATSNGTAAAGADYTATSGTLSFANGETSKTFNVSLLDDALDEANETVNISLSNPTGGATLTSPSTAVLTINDNDPSPSLKIAPASVVEGNTGTVNAVFSVTLSAASGQTVSVNYATANGTATAGSDYAAATGALSFSPGQTTKTINVVVNGDVTDRVNETFFVNLSNPTNATIAVGQALGIIIDDDATSGDFDGDRKTDVAIYKPASGKWNIIRSSDGALVTQQFGINGDTPQPGDYDRDGKNDFAVWRSTAGVWYILKSSDGSNTSQPLGASGDVPVSAPYIIE